MPATGLGCVPPALWAATFISASNPPVERARAVVSVGLGVGDRAARPARWADKLMILAIIQVTVSQRERQFFGAG